MTDPCIAIAGLSKSYGERVGVRDVHLTVATGSVHGFLGPNGAGKTTTIRVLLGLLRGDAGRVEVFGKDTVRDGVAIRRSVGYLPGDLRLHRWMTATSALRIFGRVRGEDLRERGAALLELFDLPADVRVREMSRGMQQKLGLILALVHDPALLVLDEPTTALDPITQARLYECLRARAAGGATVFFSSHVLSEVQDLCDRVAIVRGGELVADEAVATLQAQARRAVRILWAGGAPAIDPPAWLQRFEVRGSEWRGELAIGVPEFLRWLEGRSVGDLTIAEPDLDRLFLGFYEAGPPC